VFFIWGSFCFICFFFGKSTAPCEPSALTNQICSVGYDLRDQGSLP
jgi:hypothetical protein